MAKPDGSALTQPSAASRDPGGGPKVTFDTTELKSSYCNVCNGSSTREEIVLNFGVNNSWDLGPDKLEIALQHRIVMSPHAAKRVRDMMIRLLDEYETRHGKLTD